MKHGQSTPHLFLGIVFLAALILVSGSFLAGPAGRFFVTSGDKAIQGPSGDPPKPGEKWNGLDHCDPNQQPPQPPQQPDQTASDPPSTSPQPPKPPAEHTCTVCNVGGQQFPAADKQCIPPTGPTQVCSESETKVTVTECTSFGKSGPADIYSYAYTGQITCEEINLEQFGGYCDSTCAPVAFNYNNEKCDTTKKPCWRYSFYSGFITVECPKVDGNPLPPSPPQCNWVTQPGVEGEDGYTVDMRGCQAYTDPSGKLVCEGTCLVTALEAANNCAPGTTQYGQCDMPV